MVTRGAGSWLPQPYVVTHVYPSYDPADFDLVADRWLADRPRLIAFRDYLLFARVLWSADIVSAFFDGGFLRATPLSQVPSSGFCASPAASSC